MSSGHRSIDLDAPFAARSAFTHDGVQYAEGAPFPWRDLGVSERQLWTLWGARLIDNVPPPPPSPPPAELDNVPTHADPDPARMSPEQLLELAAPTALPPIVTADPPRAPSSSSKRAARR